MQTVTKAHSDDANDIASGGGGGGGDSNNIRKPVAPTLSSANGHGSGSPAHLAFSSDKPWYKQPYLQRLNLAIISLVQLSSTNGYDGSLLYSLQALPQWQTFMKKPVSAWLGFIVASQAIGQIIAYPIVSWVVQRFGRKKGLWLGYLCLAVGVSVQASAVGPAGFIVGRAFVGAATGSWFTSAPLLITEVAEARTRGVVTGLWNCGWFLGGLVSAWVAYGTRNIAGSWAWRLPSILQLALPLLAIPGLLYLPESPRWLIAQDYTEAARLVIVKHHAGGQNLDPIVDYEVTSIKTAIQQEKEAYPRSSSAWLAMLNSRRNWKRSFITITVGVFAQWNGVGIVQYYLVLVLQSVGITAVRDQTLINGCLQIWNLVCAVSGAVMVEKAGRRKLFNTSNVCMLCAFVVVTALSSRFDETKNAAVGVAVIPMLFLYYGAYDIAWNPLIFAYTVEIWPYSLRSRGLVLCMLSTAFALLFNIFVNPIALGRIGWRYYIVYIRILLVETIVCWIFYPETKGRTLEEIAIMFDGDQANLGTLKMDAAVVEKDEPYKLQPGC